MAPANRVTRDPLEGLKGANKKKKKERRSGWPHFKNFFSPYRHGLIRWPYYATGNRSFKVPEGNNGEGADGCGGLNLELSTPLVSFLALCDGVIKTFWSAGVVCPTSRKALFPIAYLVPCHAL